MQDKPLLKVTAYITRGDGSDKELLVFRHPSAGIQLPAGTIEEGEEPVDAALREAEEETGLAGLAISRLLAEDETTLPSDQRAVLDIGDLLAEPRPDAPVIERVGRSGFFVAVGETSGEYRQVTNTHHEFIDNVFVPVRSVDGWMLESNLARRIVRYHYEIGATEGTPERWKHVAEGEHEFALYWAPLREDIGLAASNLAWLRLVLETLRHSGAFPPAPPLSGVRGSKSPTIAEVPEPRTLVFRRSPG